jgi:hypothetical protein
MDEKERFDAFMKLTDYHFRTWDARRQHEQYPLSLACWGLVIAAAAYSPQNMSYWTFGIGVAVLASIYYYWLSNLIRSNTLDRYREQAARASALAALDDSFKGDQRDTYDAADAEAKARALRRGHWSVITLRLVTLVVIVAGTLVLWARKQPPPISDDMKAAVSELSSNVKSLEKKIADLEQALPKAKIADKVPEPLPPIKHSTEHTRK